MGVEAKQVSGARKSRRIGLAPDPGLTGECAGAFAGIMNADIVTLLSSTSM